MTLTQLRYIIAIADTGSMNEAAKSLFISQPSLSLAVKELEKENYNMVSNDIDWNIYENADKNTKIAAFTPIKYGMCWYE